ncbi:MAG: hypothetical protein A3G93_02935 [Nitrospinae bacterium RIFCSPLOWO2_12_FULL_45_22]|nr:MAG: hypothetical protein A3G93_02935 [Nitrospinae bacterium RIFCSPLOWO2_12_FULL_45_22]
MPLDPERQAILDIYCHVFEKLLGHLNIFETPSIIDCDCYAIVRECFDPAVKEFGKNPPLTNDKGVLLQDLLKKIEGLFSFNYSSHNDLLDSFQRYKYLVLNTPILSPTWIDNSQEIGERLSCQFYSQVSSQKYQGLERSVTIVITPSNKTFISSVPQKSGGISEICLTFGVADFDFKTYVNLPFYFFHEYLSHIHSASLFNECNLTQTSLFEDGWLIYIAHHKYENYIRSNPEFAEELSHKEHYLKSYIYSITDREKGNNHAQKGYELAERFAQIVGEELCHKISLLLAMHDYDSLPGYSFLHTKFLFIVNNWLPRYFKMGEDEKKDEVELMTLAIDDQEPLKSVLELME